MATFSAKTWVDRISEYPTRRTLTKENGTSEIVTVARSEGTVSKEGDAFSAANMNNLETRIGKAITSVNTDIAALKKYVGDGKTLVAKAITDKGKATAADASFQTMSDNVRLMAGVQYGYGVTAADARVNTSSASYTNGYAAGQASATKTARLTTNGYSTNAGTGSDDDNVYHVRFYINGSQVADVELGPHYDSYSSRIYQRLINWNQAVNI